MPASKNRQSSAERKVRHKTEAAEIVKINEGDSVEGHLIDMQVKDLYSP